jgi:hypothetical protein
LMPHAQLFQLPIEDQDIDIISFGEWVHLEPAIATRVLTFLKGVTS